MKNKKRLRIFLIITILWMVFIFVQSALTADLSSWESGLISGFIARIFAIEQETASFIIRKCAHFTEYLILGGLLSLTLREMIVKRFIPYLVAFGIGVLYAFSDELHQMFVAGRSGEIRDVLIDCSGVFLGVLIILLIKWRKDKACGT